jgi:hypothetical protein
MVGPKPVLFRIRPSRGYPGFVSIEPYPTPRLGTVSIQSELTEAGYKEGDIVEVRLYHGTRIAPDQLPPPGQLAKRHRPSRGKR